MISTFRALWNDESGTASVEYALLLALIVCVAIPSWVALRDTLRRVLSNACRDLGGE